MDVSARAVFSAGSGLSLAQQSTEQNRQVVGSGGPPGKGRVQGVKTATKMAETTVVVW